MSVVEKVRAAIKKHEMIKDGAHIVLGLSGGPDSVCLFYALMELSKELGFTIHPIHVNHGLRGEDADKDQEYCERLCKNLGIEIKVFRYDCHEYSRQRGLTVEEGGRELRYDSFGKAINELASTYDCFAESAKRADYSSGSDSGSAPMAAKNSENGEPGALVEHIPGFLVALAHNMDDQAETVLFRIIRGTGVDGLRGMDYIREDERGYKVIRPLLDVSREEIEAYLEERGIVPCIDKTNKEPTYFRNKIRLKLIPQLEEYNPRIKEALVRISKAASQEIETLETIANNAYEGIAEKKDGKVYLNKQGLERLDPGLRRRILLRAFKEAGVYRDFTMGSFEEALKVVSDNNSSRRASIPKGFYIEDVYGKLVLGKEDINGSLEDESGNGKKKSPEDRTEIRIQEFIGENPSSLSKQDDDQTLDLKAQGESKTSADQAVGHSEEKVITASFDLEELEKELGEGFKLIARGRKSGDIIRLPGGSKKLQDLLVDKKIPRDERDSVIIIASGNKVLMVIAEGSRPLVLKSALAPYKNPEKKGLFVEILVTI